MRMRDLYSKTNAPYLIAGAFATLALLASGTLPVAPYVEFLSSVAAFNVALPVALSFSILSVLVLALSCKMIKKIEVEKNKFAEKEQKLANVKQQFESKVQELENKITLGEEAKEAASKEVEELKKQQDDAQQKLDGAIKELSDKNSEIQELKSEIENLEKKIQELRIKNTEPSAKVEDQLKHEKNVLFSKQQELHTENITLSKKVDSLTEELLQSQKEVDSLKAQLNELKHEGTLALSLEEQIADLEKKRKEAAVRLRTKRDETSSLEKKLKDSEKRAKELSNDIKELEKKLYQLEREKKRLEGEVSYERQEHTRFKNEVDKLSTKEKKHLSKIEELEKELLSLKADEEELVNQSINVKDDYKKNVNKFEEKKREYVTKTVFTVLSVVKERVEQGLFNLEEQDMQDTDRIQEAVDEFMQPIYEKLGINNQLDISSEHSSEFKGTGENKLANGLTFPKPLSPHTSTPRRYLRKSLSPKKEDEDENKENSEQLNHESLDTNINSPHSSPFKDTTNNSYHTLKM